MRVPAAVATTHQNIGAYSNFGRAGCQNIFSALLHDVFGAAPLTQIILAGDHTADKINFACAILRYLVAECGFKAEHGSSEGLPSRCARVGAAERCSRHACAMRPGPCNFAECDEVSL